MAANLNPSEQAVYPEAISGFKSWLDSMRPEAEKTPEGRRLLKVATITLDEPHIEANALEAIIAPTLVLASDHDVAREEHTLEIYHHLPNSQLCVFPDATHMIPYDDPARFNAAVDRFFRTPFVKKDRMKDMIKSFEAMRASQQ